MGPNPTGLESLREGGLDTGRDMLREGDSEMHRNEERLEQGGGHQRSRATRQGPPGAPGSWKRQEGPSPERPPATPDFQPLASRTGTGRTSAAVSHSAALGSGRPGGTRAGGDGPVSGSPAHHLCDLLQRDLVVARVLLGQSPRGRDGAMGPVQPAPPPCFPMQVPTAASSLLCASRAGAHCPFVRDVSLMA